MTPFLRIYDSVSICFIEIRLSYPLRCYAPPPLSKRGDMDMVGTTPPLMVRGGMSGWLRDTPPYHKGKQGVAGKGQETPPAIREAVVADKGEAGGEEERLLQ